MQTKTRSKGKKRELKLGIKLILVGLAVLLVVFLVDRFAPKGGGYYYYHDTYYYQSGESWYAYDGERWIYTDIDDELKRNSEDYFQDGGYREDFGIEDFRSDDAGDWEQDWNEDNWDWEADSDWDLGDEDLDSEW